MLVMYNLGSLTVTRARKWSPAISCWQDTGRSAKGCTRAEPDVVWEQLKPISQPSTVRLGLVMEEEKRRDDLCSFGTGLL